MNKISKYVVLFIVIVFLIFVFQNMEQVSVVLLFWNFSMPRALLMCVLVFIGLFIGLLLRSSQKQMFK